MSTRTQLSAYLAAALGDEYQCAPADVTLDEFPVGMKAAIIVDAPTFEPAANAQGAYMLTFPVLVVVNTGDPELDADQFDDVLPEVFAALDADTSLLWSDAKPGMYDTRKPCYTISITTTTAKG
jgi:hypothetical protein